MSRKFDTRVASRRCFRHGVIEREDAQIGVLISMEAPTKPMLKEAAEAGFYKPHKQFLLHISAHGDVAELLAIEEHGGTLAKIARFFNVERLDGFLS